MEIYWQRNAAETTQPQWEGDLEDDCSAEWAGLTLRAEEMEENYWWWCVYDNELTKHVSNVPHTQVRSSNDDGAVQCTTGGRSSECGCECSKAVLGLQVVSRTTGTKGNCLLSSPFFCAGSSRKCVICRAR